MYGHPQDGLHAIADGMRLWTLHPRYLDRQGLLGLWREGLLAQRVLTGATRGFRYHPQLDRFWAQPDPEAAIAAYLRGVHAEAMRRGYRFDASKIADRSDAPPPIEATDGQLAYEQNHLLRKLNARAPEQASTLERIETPDAHPLFRIVPGPIAPWERPIS